MSNFDLGAFRKAKFTPREEDVPLAELAEAGLAESGEAGKKPAEVVFRVRGLTAQELAKADEEADSSQLLAKVAERLAGSEAEKVQALVDGLGLGQGTPKTLAKKIAHVQMGVIDPEMKVTDVAKLADAFPMEFTKLANRIYGLTGKGKVAQVKRKPSGSKATSMQA